MYRSQHPRFVQSNPIPTRRLPGQTSAPTYAAPARTLPAHQKSRPAPCCTTLARLQSPRRPDVPPDVPEEVSLVPERVKIVVPGDNPQQIQGSPRLAALEPYGDVTVYTDRPSSLEQQVERLQGATILLNSRGAVRWPGEVLRQLPSLKFITIFGIGTDSIDLVTAKELGITVSNIPGKTAPSRRRARLRADAGSGQARRLPDRRDARRPLGHPHRQRLLERQDTRRDRGRADRRPDGALGKAIGMNVIAWTFNPTPERAARMGVEFVSAGRPAPALGRRQPAPAADRPEPRHDRRRASSG